MRVKAYQERQRKRVEVSLQTRGLLLRDEACMKSKKKCESTRRLLKKLQKDYLLVFTLAVIVLDCK